MDADRLTIYLIASAALATACRPVPDPAPRTTFEDDHVVVPADQRKEEVPQAEPQPEVVAQPAPQEPKDERGGARDTFVPEPEFEVTASRDERALAHAVKTHNVGFKFSPLRNDGKCGPPDYVRAVADPAAKSIHVVEACVRAVDVAHSLAFDRYKTRLGVLDVSSVAIRHDGQRLWTAAQDCIELRQSENACPGDFVLRTPSVRSFVGPLLSYEINTQSKVAGRGVAKSSIGMVVDVRTGMSASFGSLVQKDSLLNALKRSLPLRRAVDPAQLDSAMSVDAVFDLWRTQDFAQFGGYYFAEWDPKTAMVSMRLWYLEESTRKGDNSLKELEIWVAPKPRWRSAFEDAAAKSSGFLGDS